MKVRVEVTVDIDPGQWELDYGVYGHTAIRADVRLWARTLVTETLREQGHQRQARVYA